MADEKKPYPSRLKKKNRSNSILNMLIGLVFALILIVGAFIFLSQNDDNENAQEPESVEIASDTGEQTSDEDNSSEDSENNASEEDANAQESGNQEENPDEDKAEAEAEEKNEKQKEKDEKEKEKDEKEKEKNDTDEGKVTVGGTITREKSEDPIVEETVINTSWMPVGTSQTGEHISVYDESSVDWKEKIEAITYATGLSAGDMHVMRLQNGGSPQKSVGVVQSKDTSEKYRVYLEWVDNDGWKPVKMDVLKTLEGAY